MIEQYPIVATPKYNFPKPNMDTILPQQFTELSLHSLENVRPPSFQLNQQILQQINNPDEHVQALRLKPEPILLKPVRKENTVVAVDTSTIRIGETSQGILIAVRGAEVWKYGRNYRYMRLGPFIFHVSDENKKEVYGELENSYLSSQSQYDHQGTPTLLQMPTRIATLLERWMQTMMSKTTKNGLVLFDGSLISGTADTSTQRMRGILNVARNRGNVVLAFSKVTNLRFNGYLITDLLPDATPPYLLETEGLRPKPPMVLLGDIYVARLSKGNCAFRLDIDREITKQARIEAVERLLGSDLFLQSYPETLRLAHILCTFTANEVLAMQHFISRNYGLQIINRPDMHRLLFGPFGKGESYS